MNQDILKDLVTTSVSNDYDYDKVLAAFPELQSYDRQVLQDYVQTAVDNDFKYDKVNKAFPEFFPEHAKTKKEKTSKDDTTPESKDGVSTSEDGSSESNLSEEALAKIKELEEYEKENPHLKQIQDLNAQRQDSNLPLLNDQDYEYSLNEKGEGQWTVPDAGGAPAVVDDEMSKVLEEKRVRDNEWAKKNMPVVDEDLISTDDGGWDLGFGIGSTGSLDMFNDRYSEYGFTFENPSIWKDSLKVTAKNGATMEFDVDNSSDEDKRVAAEVNEFMQKNAIRFDSGSQGQAANIKTDNQQKSENLKKASDQTNNYADLKDKVDAITPEDLEEEQAIRKELRDELLKKSATSKTTLPIAKMLDKMVANKYKQLGKDVPSTLKSDLENNKNSSTGKADDDARLYAAKEQYADSLGLEGENRNKFMNSSVNMDLLEKDVISGTSSDGEVVSLKNIYDGIDRRDERVVEVANKTIAAELNQKTTQKNMRIAVENFDGGWFAQSETQKKFEKEGKTALDDLDKDKKDAIVTLDLVNKTIKEAKVEQDALKEKINAASIRKQIEAISSKEYSTQEEIDAANAEISKIKSEYESNVKKYNVYATDNKALFDSRNTAYRKIQNLNFTDDQLDQFTSVLGKNHQLGTQGANAAANATIDLVQGLEQFVYIVNPFGEASDWAVEEYGDTMPSAFKDLINVGKVVTGQALSVDWDNNPVTSTMRDSGKEAMDFWQEDFSKRVQDPIAFDDIENSSDAGEWFGVMLGGQIPTLTAMALTGGTAGLITMGATSAGQKFDALDKERNLYKQTGGEQGQDYGFGNMWLNSMLSGAAEGLSEKITFGQMKYVKGALRGTVSTAREAGVQGFSKYMRQNLFNARNVKAFSKDLVEEGGSESVATIAGNVFDMASGKQGVNVFDDVAESFVSGIGISGSMKSPVLFKHMYRPFKSVSASDAMASNNSRLQDIKRRLHEEKNTLSKEETQDLQEEVGQLLHKNKELIEIDVNRVDALTDGDKSSLLKIDKNQTKLQQEFQRITNDKSIPDDVKQRDLDRLNQKYEKNLDSKNEIINKYPPTDVKKHQQNQQLLIEKTNNELKKMGSPLSIKVNEISDQQMKDNIADDEYGKQSKEVEEIVMEGSAVASAEIEAANEIINNPKSTAKQIKDAKENKKEAEALVDNLSSAGNLLSGSAKTYGSMLPVFEGEGSDKKLTGFQIDINKSAALKNGKFSTRAHEFVHSVVYNTMNNNPAIRKALGDGVINMLNGDGMTFKPGKDALFNKRISGYAANMQGEEILTIASEMLADGDIEFNDTLLQKIKDFYRQFAQTYLGRDIEFNSNEDVRNFMKDLHVSIKNNKPNAAVTKMMAEGAGGLMIDQATAPKKTITPEEASSQRVFSKAVDANLNSNPDLKQTFDKYTQNEDGSPKHKSQEDFEASPDYYDAYLEIVEGRSLDGLVQQGMTKKGLPPEALREFTRKAKEEIGKRYLPKIDKKTGEVKPESGYRVSNSSLFGWLTGVAGGAGMSIIYRAKGDVMVQYKKDKIAETTSLDKTVGDGAGKISDLMQGERDALLDRLDEEDLSIGRKDAVREVVNELKAREVFEFNKSTNDAIDSALDDADISIENLTYKGIKQFLSSAEKITREDKNGNVIVDEKTGNPKLFSPTKASDAKPNGPLFNVLDAVSKHFGIDALRILANQDLDGPQRKSAQLKIFNSLIDTNGNLNQDLIGILAEGQTRSGEATGAANTKLGDLYAEGGRLKVAEGAKKSLGQKKAQDKRTDITKAEALELFNMNEAGTNLGGTKGDGAIRAFVVQMAQLEANQQLRIKSIQEGTSSDATRALLGDGKGLMAFSMDTEGLDDRIPQLIETVAISDMNPPTIAGIVADVYEGTDLKPSQVKKIEKNILAKVKDFKDKDESLKGKWSDISGKDVNEFFIDAFLAEDAKFNKGISKNLQNLIPLDENGKKIVIGNRAKSIDGGTKQRDFLVNATRDLKNEVGAKQAAETIIRQLLPMYAGASKIADGSIMPIEDGGEVIDTPNWEGEDGGKWKRYKKGDKLPKGKNIGDFKLDKKGKKIAKDNRQQVTTGKDDFIALVSKGLGPGVKITSPKQGTYMLIEADGSSVKLDVSMPTESTKAFFVESRKKSLADIFETRKKASLEARKEVKRLGDAAWGRVQDPNDSFDAADFGLLIMSLGSSMNAPLRRAAYLSKIPQNFDEMAKKYGEEALGQIFQYEHAIPKEEIAGKIIQSYTTKGKLDESIFDGYEVNIIHKAMDKAIDGSGHKFTTRPDGNSRALNEDTALLLAKNASQTDISELSPLMSIDPNNQSVEGDNFIKIVKALRNNKPYEISSLVGAVGRKRNWSKDTPSRGMSTFDFDDTLAFTKSGIRLTMPNPSGKPQPKRKAILIAGNAGAGKTTIINKLGLRQQGFKYVNQDIALDWLTKNNGLPKDMNEFTREQTDKWRELGGQAAVAAKNKASRLQGEGDGVVIDGTGAVGVQFQGMARDFNDAGYDVQVVFIESSLETAIDRNKGRSERRLTDATIRNSVVDAQKNKKAFKEMVTFFPFSAKGFIEVNTDNLTQDGPLPADLVSKMDDFTKGYIKDRINAEDFALRGADLLAQGAEYDFSEFNKVVDGTPGPLLDKAKNRAEKFGTENLFVLTARPAEAAKPIRAFLKSQGIDIPLKNITGLGNSTGAAKAEWMLRKFEEGYNDMYFVDDALPNVEAVANVIDSLDIKGKSVQAERRFSSEAASELDNMLERSKGVDANEKFNRVKARNKGIKNRKRQIFIPPSAEDFQGLMYYNMGKGAQGDADAGFFKKMFYDPFNKADRELDMYRQTLRQKATSISKALPNVRKKLRKDFAKTGYTVEQAMRIYLYDMNGRTVPSISEADQKKIASAVAVDSEMVLFANAIQDAVGIDGYLDPKAGWNAGSFNSDMADASKIKRTEFLQEWNENIDATFTEQALNKLEAIHGPAYRSALIDSIRRMKSGTNRPTIKDKKVNAFLDWTNGSVGAIMFFNARSAVLQTLSTVNFINFEDNNLFAASKAFANQKQFWTDFKMLYNSPMLKQRRGGLQTDVSAEELSRAQEQGGTKAVIAKLLQVGFTPTQIADSFAISAGGASFYRNRVNKYLSEGLTQQEADNKAFEDFQEIAEQTQQSSRPDKISQEQASVLGRLILAFQNTPMQYNRLIKKAALDLINGRGSFKANVSRIIYYGAVQNLIFASLQNALFAAFGDDEEDEEFLDKKIERIANGTLDSLLRGSGIYGAIIATAKNTILKWQEERAKGKKQDNAKVLVEAVNVSPPLGSKLRKINSALNTDKWNKEVYGKIPLSNIDNPLWDAIGSTVEGLTNVPLGRIQRKISNLKAASDDSNATWQRAALLLGWDKWGLGIDRPQEVEEAKQEAKEENREVKNQERKAREAEVKQEQEEKYLEKQKEEKKEDKKPRCAAATKNGGRCKGTPVDGTYCTIHARVEQRTDGKDVQCKKIKSDGKRCGMQTSNKSGLCYYHD